MSGVSVADDRQCVFRPGRASRPACAFVVFDSMDSRARCLDAFPHGRVRRLCCTPAAKRFRGRVLAVKAAPAPSAIRWENLGAGKRERLLRHLATGAVTLVLLSGSVLSLTFARTAQKKHQLEYPASTCGDVPPTKDDVVADFLPVNFLQNTFSDRARRIA